MKFYWWLLRTFRLFERRCGWCKKFMGWKSPRSELPRIGDVTHGICEPCRMKFEAESDALAEPRWAAGRFVWKDGQLVQARRLKPAKRTLRRRTGGWGGAVATPHQARRVV